MNFTCPALFMGRYGISLLVLLSGSLAFANLSLSTASQSLRAVPFTNVKLTGGFWGPRIETNRTVSLPHSLKMLEKSGNIKDLELAAAGAREGYEGPLFIDSDLYKAIEAISYSLASHPDAELEIKLDEIIAKIAAAQMDDGYLNTYFQVVEPDKRWTNLRDKHELYCAGHLMEAAVAHYQATGKRTLLDVAVKFADYIDSVFGDTPGKRMGYPGHEEIELALIKLWRVTGEQRYFDLSKFFLENRGQKFFAKEHNTPIEKYNGEYWQDNVPVRDHEKIVGHAVRAVYLLSGATDYAAEIHDPTLLKMIDRVWRNTTEANMYVTGGIGSSAKNEGFTFDYDLPNFTGYQETCASVAMIMWNHRLSLLSGDSKYVDFLERALYNGFLAGVSLDGRKFFYVNPMASHGHHHRLEWYGCACCPPNVTRTLAQLGGYAYATSPGALWINLYMQGALKTTMNGQDLAFRVTTEYPWDGQIRIQSETATTQPLELRLRIPDWCTSHTVTVNSRIISSPLYENGYLVLNQRWNSEDEIALNLDMPVRRVAADSRVTEDRGRLAIQRGPLVYCLEEVDNKASVHKVALEPTAGLQPQRRPDLLGDVVVLTGHGTVASVDSALPDPRLYSFADTTHQVPVTAIPYYAWDNRSPGDMAVWIPVVPPAPPVITPESLARATMSFPNENAQPGGANDGIIPARSTEQPPACCHWWPHKGTTEWLQYDWDKAQIIKGARVFWFDDTDRGGECQIPASWHLEYKDGNQWKPVKVSGDYEVALDRFCEVEFEPVSTASLRLVVQLNDGFAAGVHELQVVTQGTK